MLHNQIWQNCIAFIKDNLNDQNVFDTWFKPIQAVKYENNTLQIRVPTMFFYEYLEEHYVYLLKGALKHVIGENAKLKYAVDVEKPVEYKQSSVALPTQNTQTYTKPNSMAARAEEQNYSPFNATTPVKQDIDPNLNSTYTFENYIEGDCNRLVTSVAKAISSSPGNSAYNPLFVFGKSGVGKTHISQAIAHKVLLDYPNKTVLYLTANTFVTQYQAASVRNAVPSFINFYQKVDLLILDDIHDLIGKTGTQNVFFHIFNHLQQMGKQLILTCDRPVQELEGMPERLITRFKWGLPVKIELPDYETRLKILEFKMYRDGMSIPTKLLEYSAKNLTTSVREIEGFYISLMAHSTLNNREISIELIDSILTNFVSKTEPKELNVELICEIVAKYYNLDLSDLYSKSRKRDVVQARQISMQLSKELTNKSLSAIGKIIGNRNHATVLYAIKSVKDQLDTNAVFKQDFENIKEQLRL